MGICCQGDDREHSLMANSRLYVCTMYACTYMTWNQICGVGVDLHVPSVDLPFFDPPRPKWLLARTFLFISALSAESFHARSNLVKLA